MTEAFTKFYLDKYFLQVYFSLPLNYTLICGDFKANMLF